MPKLNLKDANYIKAPFGDIKKLKGLGYEWTSLNYINTLYGTGLGQIPLHLRPENSVLDVDGNVMSIVNQGGAGAYFDATANATDITRTGNLFSVPSTNTYFNLANLADLVGTRLFMLARLTTDVANYNFSGMNESSVDGFRNNFRWETNGKRFALMRFNGSNWNNTYLSKGSPLGTDMNLIELEIAAGNAKLFVNGIAYATAACDYSNFRIRRVFGGHSVPFFTGTAGDVVSLITDGSSAMDAPIATIRNMYAKKYGLTLS